MAGAVPSMEFPFNVEKDTKCENVVWVWSHASVDGEGKKAEHFDLISQDLGGHCMDVSALTYLAPCKPNHRYAPVFHEGLCDLDR